MAGAAEPTAAQAAAYIQNNVTQAQSLLPWISVAADGASPPELAGNFEEAISKPLQTLVGRAYSRLWVSEELAPSARLAAQLAVGGLAAGLPPADALDLAMQDSLLSLCRMLHKKMHWDLLDKLAAGSCAALFTSETGLVDLMDLAADQQGGLRLNKAFPAVAKRCAALGRVEGAAALLAFADEGGCSNGTELAEIVCTALCSPAGAAFLSGLAEGRQALLCTAICKHASGEHSARLLAALHGLPECQPRARMALALALVRAAGQQCAGLLASVPGFHAALAALEQELQEQLQHGPPTAPNPHGRPLPPAIVERFQCDRSPPGQHCNLCQPVVAFMRGEQLETQPILRFEEGGLRGNLDHLRSTLEACQQRCALNKFMEHRIFEANSKEADGKGKKRGPKRQVAAVRLWKVDTFYHEQLAAYRSLKQMADDLEAALALAPANVPPAAPAAEPAEVAAATAAEAAQQQQVAAQPEAAAEDSAVVQRQSAAQASPAQQQEQAAGAAASEAAQEADAGDAEAAAEAATEAAAEQPDPAAEAATAAEQPAAAAGDAAEVKAAIEPKPAAEEPSPDVSVEAAAPVEQPASAAQAAATVEEPAAAPEAAAAAPAAEAMDVEEQEQEAASAAAATPGAPAAAAQLLAAEDTSVLVGAEAPASQLTPAERGPPSRPLVQCTLLSNGGLIRLPPPEQEASQDNRRLSLGPESSAKTAASGSTARKRPAAGSTAKKGGGEGSRTRAWLARDAQRLRLPTLYYWFKPDHQHLSEAECASLASSLPCRRLDWEDAGQEVDSGAADGAPAVVTAAANGQTAAGRGKRSRKA